MSTRTFALWRRRPRSVGLLGRPACADRNAPGVSGAARDGGLASVLRAHVPRVLAGLCAAALAACGGGGDSPAPPAEPVPAPLRSGQLESSALLRSIPVADISAAVAGKESLAEGVVPRYSVAAYRIEYITQDADGKEVRASGLVSVPQKPPGAASPVLSYQHGTIFRDAEAPSNNAVASEVAVVLASQGYIVLAPDYVGFGASRNTPHPYLLSRPSAAATADFLTAARTWRAQAQVADNGQLFLTGYSEGGYVTMAAHRALQESGSPHLQQLRMAVVGAGPYNVQATMDGLVDLVRQEQPALGALLNPGLLRYLGGSVQREVRRLLLRALIPGDADVAYDTRFIDRFLADDVRYLSDHSNVYDWSPGVPVRLYHGRDDRTVPYSSAVSTVRAMHQRGAGDRVSLTDCSAQPAGHMQCVPPFILFMLGQFGQVARDL
ncbi:lipase family protein [Paracidovorax sp. MALMAid1276]|uniref:lipase family protein n=1 Tax=Paracidovorax sp. MALMAid1276 TaxID=3411631 RepID=UPI003B996937